MWVEHSQNLDLIAGRLGPMVTGTLKLGISILNGGNVLVQQVKNLTGARHVCCVSDDTDLHFCCVFLKKMLDYLKEKRDAGFFKSLSGLMMSCR